MMEGPIIDAYNRGSLSDNINRDYYVKNPLKSGGAVKLARQLMHSKLEGATNPIVAFARLAAFFAGQQEFKMQVKLEEYRVQHERYKKVLEYSKLAHQKKLEAANAKADIGVAGRLEQRDFNHFMNTEILTLTAEEKRDHWIDANIYLGGGQDTDRNNLHSEDDWDGFIKLIDKKKDMESTDLNKLSTEMDMAVKESDSAQQMAANAIKKANDLIYELAKTSGG